MNRFSRYVITAGAVSLAASLGTTAPVSAAPAGKPRCLQQPAEQVGVLWWPGVTGHSDNLIVAVGSPCRDINVSSIVDVDGKPTCRRLRVRWSNGQKTGWQRTCNRWTVLAVDAQEGRSYVIEGTGRPAGLAVRS